MDVLRDDIRRFLKKEPVRLPKRGIKRAKELVRQKRVEMRNLLADDLRIKSKIRSIWEACCSLIKGGEQMSEKKIKSGVLTSEFWTMLGAEAIAIVYQVIQGSVDWQIAVGQLLTAVAYILSRGYVKAKT